MTADFRNRLVETVETQILRVHEALTRYRFSSFLYLSSARIYAGASSTREDTPIPVRSWDVDHVYNISKLAGESLCFALQNPMVRVVRLSNVYGTPDKSNLFLTAVMREAVMNGIVTIGQAPQSSKDYIRVEEAAEAIVRVAREGRQQLYNIAAGQNMSHADIAEILRKAGYEVVFKDGGAVAEFPPIDTARFTDEFRTKPSDARKNISGVLKELQQLRASR